MKVQSNTAICYKKALSLWKDVTEESNQNHVGWDEVIIRGFGLFYQGSLYFQGYQSLAGGDTVSIVSMEGMLFSMLEEVKRAPDCFKESVFDFQDASQPMNLKLATVLFEMGSLYSRLERYDKSTNCFNSALGIRKSLLSDSFIVACTHYRLGVTLISLELK